MHILIDAIRNFENVMKITTKMALRMSINRSCAATNNLLEEWGSSPLLMGPAKQKVVDHANVYCSLHVAASWS